MKLTFPGNKKSAVVCASAVMTALLFAASSRLLAADMKLDVSAAKALAKNSNCLKCHAVERKKEGPSFQEIAIKGKDNPNAENAMAVYLKKHGNLTSKDEAGIRNLARYILSR